MTSTSHECSFVLEHGSLGDKKPVDFVNICGRIGPMVANMQNPVGLRPVVAYANGDRGASSRRRFISCIMM